MDVHAKFKIANAPFINFVHPSPRSLHIFVNRINQKKTLFNQFCLEFDIICRKHQIFYLTYLYSIKVKSFAEPLSELLVNCVLTQINMHNSSKPVY